MILMHAMEAPYAIPGIGIRRGDTMYHLLSDIPSAAGTEELLAFVRACGGRDVWIQSAGTYREHFDIFGKFAALAQELGAKPATNAEVAAVLTRKRSLQEDTRLPVATLTSRQKRAVWRLMERHLGITATAIADRASPHVVTLTQQVLNGAIIDKRIVILQGTLQDSLSSAIAGALSAAGAKVSHLFVGVAPEHDNALYKAAAAHPNSLITDAPLAAANLASSDLLIDRLLPWESTMPPSPEMASAIAAINATPIPTLAIDVPSGLDTDPDDRGRNLPWLRATSTLALGVPLRGLTLISAAAAIGDLWLADVGIPRRLLKQVGTRMGPIFARDALVRLEAVRLGDAAGEIVRWVVAEK